MMNAVYSFLITAALIGIASASQCFQCDQYFNTETAECWEDLTQASQCDTENDCFVMTIVNDGVPGSVSRGCNYDDLYGCNGCITLNGEESCIQCTRCSDPFCNDDPVPRTSAPIPVGEEVDQPDNQGITSDFQCYQCDQYSMYPGTDSADCWEDLSHATQCDTSNDCFVMTVVSNGVPAMVSRGCNYDDLYGCGGCITLQGVESCIHCTRCNNPFCNDDPVSSTSVVDQADNRAGATSGNQCYQCASFDINNLDCWNDLSLAARCTTDDECYMLYMSTDGVPEMITRGCNLEEEALGLGECGTTCYEIEGRESCIHCSKCDETMCNDDPVQTSPNSAPNQPGNQGRSPAYNIVSNRIK